MNKITDKEQQIIDYLKDFEVNVDIEYKIVTSLVSSLSAEALKVLGDSAKDQFARYRADKRLKILSRKYKRNTSVKTLLERYTNKKSGKVVASKEELFARFPSLDFKEQKLVLSAFLAGCETDCEEILNYFLRGNWDDGYADIVTDAWQACPTSTSIGRLVIRFAPLPFVMEHKDALESGAMLSARLCEGGIMPKMEDWGPVNYLAIRYYAGKFVDDQEAKRLVMQYLVSSAKYAIERCRIPDYSRRVPEEFPSLIFLDGVRILLYYLGKMQMVDVLDWFYKMDSDFLRKFRNEGGFDHPIEVSMTTDQWKTYFWKKYCKAFIDTYNNPEYKVVRIRLTEDVPLINSGEPDHVESTEPVFYESDTWF